VYERIAPFGRVASCAPRACRAYARRSVATWKMVEELGASLPETEVGLWYGKPALTVAGKGFLHLGTGPELSLPSDEKDVLIAAEPEAYRSTPHHDGSSWLLVKLDKITKRELRELLADAWRMKAPAAVRRAHPEI
jgi:hypothetical protein